MLSKKDFRRHLLDSSLPWLAGVFVVHLGMAVLFRGGTWAESFSPASGPSTEFVALGGLVALAGVSSLLAYRWLMVAPLLNFRGWMVLGCFAAGLTVFGAIIDGLGTSNGLWLLLSGSTVAGLCFLRARRRRDEEAADSSEAIDAPGP